MPTLSRWGTLHVPRRISRRTACRPPNPPCIRIRGTTRSRRPARRRSSGGNVLRGLGLGCYLVEQGGPAGAGSSTSVGVEVEHGGAAACSAVKVAGSTAIMLVTCSPSDIRSCVVHCRQWISPFGTWRMHPEPGPEGGSLGPGQRDQHLPKQMRLRMPRSHHLSIGSLIVLGLKANTSTGWTAVTCTSAPTPGPVLPPTVQIPVGRSQSSV